MLNDKSGETIITRKRKINSFIFCWKSDFPTRCNTHNTYMCRCHPRKELNLSLIRRASLMPAPPGKQREMKDVNILMDNTTEESLRVPIPAKRRHSCVPGSCQLDAVNIGRRYSAHIRDTKS